MPCFVSVHFRSSFVCIYLLRFQFAPFLIVRFACTMISLSLWRQAAKERKKRRRRRGKDSEVELKSTRRLICLLSPSPPRISLIFNLRRTSEYFWQVAQPLATAPREIRASREANSTASTNGTKNPKLERVRTR